MSEKPLITRMGALLQLSLTIIGGAFLALSLHPIWTLQNRYIIAITLGVILVSLSMFFLRRFHDFLLVAFFFSIPFAGFVKTLFFLSLGYDDRVSGIMLYSGIIGVGLMDVLLMGLYLVWFVRVFVLRIQELPLPNKHDGIIFLFVVAYIVSSIGVPDRAAAIHSTTYLLRFVAIYFFCSRNFDQRHIHWLFVSVVFIVIGESLLALYQYQTGKLIGLAMDRGAGVRLHDQYTVPGIEHRNRATGTAYESHTFGTYLAILTQFCFVMVSACFQRKEFRLTSCVLLLLALVAVLISFSRSAWLSCALALGLSWFVHMSIWREREISLPTMIVILAGIILSPWMIHIVVERFVTSEGLLEARFEQFPVALNIWKSHFLFGFGVGNYMEALKIYNIPGVIELPVHNVFLWAAAETGLFGVSLYYWIAFSALHRTWRIARKPRHPHRRLALAVFCGLLVYLLDGLTDPLYREPVIYTMYWVMLGISVALTRVDKPPPIQVESTGQAAHRVS